MPYYTARAERPDGTQVIEIHVDGAVEHIESFPADVPPMRAHTIANARWRVASGRQCDACSELELRLWDAPVLLREPLRTALEKLRQDADMREIAACVRNSVDHIVHAVSLPVEHAVIDACHEADPNLEDDSVVEWFNALWQPRNAIPWGTSQQSAALRDLVTTVARVLRLDAQSDGRLQRIAAAQEGAQ